jgi:hypothetical protein
MSQPGTFDRVYAALKQRLQDGTFRPGQRLEPAILSDELNSSVTPVRDALHRLTGERLVDAPRQEGFRMPLLSEMSLRHLYAWHLDLLLIAVGHRKAARDSLTNAQRDAPSDTRVNALFASLAADNPEHAAVLGNLTERLAPYQRAEERFLDAVDLEIEGIFAALRSEDLRQLRKSLVRYHRRRQRVIPELLASLHEWA